MVPRAATRFKTPERHFRADPMRNLFRRRSSGCAACERPDRRTRSVFAMVLLCAHCSLTAAAAVAAVALASAPTFFGVGLEWILPPVFILGLFAFLVWPTRPPRHNHSIEGGEGP